VAELATITTLRDGTEVAAWLFKANPEVWDVLRHVGQGGDIDRWRMVPSYRVDFVQPGQPCVLWITGATSGSHVPGVWAIGTTTSDAYDDLSDHEDLWRDNSAAHAVRPYVDLDMELLDAPVPRVELADDPVFAGAEIIRVPRAPNPSGLRAAEFAAIVDAAGSSRPPDGR
jgi:hypothetical protein